MSVRGIEFAVGTKVAQAEIREAGYAFVVGHLGAGGVGGYLTGERAKAYIDAGLSIVSIYDAPPQPAVGDSVGYDPRLFEDPAKVLQSLVYRSGITDGRSAYALARNVGQAAGSAIYFEVDADVSAGISYVLEYFRGISDGMADASKGEPTYRVGVHGSGFVLDAVYGAGLADYKWLAAPVTWKGSTGYATRTGDLAGPSTARYAVAGSGPRPAFATDFADEVFPSGTVTFLPGEASKLITIGVAGDTTVEETEAFTVTLTSLSDDTVVETATSEGLIRDDDSINDIVVVNTQTSEQLAIDPVFYDGPVVGVEKEIILISAENLNATVSGDNWFIRTGSGTDALAAHGGRNVLDGGGGSNFLTGASGEDTFFLDARGAIADIWSTVVGFGRGDSVTLWGVSAEHAAIVWADNLGAAGFTGLTLQATMEGQPNAMVTLVGYGRADLDSGILQLTSGSFGPSSPYLHIQLAP